jgi:hypothetical protein
MKRLLALALLSGITGCAHAKLDSWQGQDFVVCGNKWCGQDCFQEQIAAACPGEAKLTGGRNDSVITGAQTYSTGYGSSSSTVTRSKRACRQYHCDKALTISE